MKQISQKEKDILIAKGKIYPVTFECQKFDDNDIFLGMYNRTVYKNLTVTKSKYYTKDFLADDLRSGKI